MSDGSPAPPVARRLKTMRVELVAATPRQIADALLHVDTTKAARVAAIIGMTVGPALMKAAVDRAQRAVARVQERPAETAAKLIGVLMLDDE